MKRELIFATAMLAVCASSSASAKEGGFVGIDIGQLSFNMDVRVVGSFPNPNDIQLGGGYYFSDNVGVEANYHFIGKASVTTADPTGVNTGGVPANISESIDTSLTNLAVVGKYPLNSQFEVLGKLGVASMKMDYAKTSTNSSTGALISGYNVDTSASGTGLMFGIGGQYNINSNFSVRLQYIDYGKVTFGGGCVGNCSIGARTLSIGSTYNF